MNYRLEINRPERGSNIAFNTIIFDSFKINIVERYSGSMPSRLKLSHVLFKVRTLDDNIIETKEGNGRVKIKGDEFETYQRARRVLDSYEYKNKIINRKKVEEDYVHLILGLVIANYNLS